MDKTAYLFALHATLGLGPIRLKLVLDYFKDPKLAWEAKEKELVEIGLPQNVINSLLETRKKLDPQEYLEQIKKSGIKWLTIFDQHYPKLLKQIYDPPVVLYYLGEIKPVDDRAIGIVGTRKMTGYGKSVTQKFAQELTNFGLTIVSGLARGVDSCAHRAAIEVGGRTIAVLGGGLNKIYPPENKKLVEEIVNGFGAVVSEFAPDEPSLPGNFPARNRIIAGLSLGILVTEAASDSGSLITARIALEEGREVFAVPGPITSKQSQGTALLIKEGARLVMDGSEIAEELGLGRPGILATEPKGVRAQNDIVLSDLEKQILECLENEGKHIDEIVRETKKPAYEISASLIKMEISGLVKNMGGGSYVKVF